MYILFTSSNDTNFFNLLFDIKDWSVHYNITYKIKYWKTAIKLILPNNDDYFLFCLTWNPDHPCDYRLIEPMKIDKS